ncbi:hypothetical protein [Algoriphagus sp. oki45]
MRLPNQGKFDFTILDRAKRQSGTDWAMKNGRLAGEINDIQRNLRKRGTN